MGKARILLVLLLGLSVGCSPSAPSSSPSQPALVSPGTSPTASTPSPPPTPSPNPTPPGTDWTPMTLPGGSGSGSVNDIVAGGPGLVAVGSVSAADGTPRTAIWTAADGITWTSVALGAGLRAGELSSVAAGDGGLMAVGLGKGAVPVTLTSRDGLTWVRTTMPGVQVGDTLTGVAALDGEFVAVGMRMLTPAPKAACDLAAWRSPDGVGWAAPVRLAGTLHRDPGTLDPWCPRVLDIAPLEGRLVVIGDTGRGSTAWVSLDGASWTSSGELVETWPGLFRLAPGLDGLMSVSRDGAWTTSDGLGWRRLESTSLTPLVDTPETIVDTGRGLVMAGSSGPEGSEIAVPTAWLSTDAAQWTKVVLSPASKGGEVLSLVACGQQLVAAGMDDSRPAMWTSPATGGGCTPPTEIAGWTRVLGPAELGEDQPLGITTYGAGMLAWGMGDRGRRHVGLARRTIVEPRAGPGGLRRPRCDRA